ncbi:CBO0543 family protein [Bacillus sp. PK3_68]|uniref:CBO0543 family protein n=1 Tax=Bacillus sp. PK3_68 TaxID=2027408 RepID=UPI00217E7CD2|nr:CBO0543 family protein [Bacillus sp. PK3_68]
MNTVKHLKGLSWQLLRKRPFLLKAAPYFPAVIAASWMGTYLDLYFVGRNLYEFPLRPFPDIFPINVAFTLFVLPLFTGLFLFLMNKMRKWGRAFFILFVSLIMPVVEKASELWGVFKHSNGWNHGYSFFGYYLFLILIWGIFKRSKEK